MDDSTQARGSLLHVQVLHSQLQTVRGHPLREISKGQITTNDRYTKRTITRDGVHDEHFSSGNAAIGSEMHYVLLSRMTVIKLMESFRRETCVLTSLIKQHIGNNSDLVSFCWHFTENTDIFLDLGSLVSQDTECIHVN